MPRCLQLPAVVLCSSNRHGCAAQCMTTRISPAPSSRRQATMPCPICDSNDHDSQCTDREAVLEAVGKDGCALEYAPDELKADKEVVLAAVGQNGDAVEHTTDELRGGGIVAKSQSSTAALQSPPAV